jgi:hypothetical protein
MPHDGWPGLVSHARFFKKQSRDPQERSFKTG